MFAHDAIAKKDFYPHLPDIPIEIDEDEETIKIVQLVKSNEPLVSFQYYILNYRFQKQSQLIEAVSYLGSLSLS